MHDASRSGILKAGSTMVVPTQRCLRILDAGARALLAFALAHCGGEVVSSAAQSDAAAGGNATSDANAGGATADDGPFSPCGDRGSPCSFDDAGNPTCNGESGWKCAVDNECPTPTALTGKVFDPAGLNPIYEAIVYIPNTAGDLPALVPGTGACGCSVSIGDYVAATATDGTGTFTLKEVPTGKDIPLVVQTGKWRRTIYVDIPSTCATNTVADGTVRLPRRRSEGDLPQMAIVTGGGDDLGCFLQRVGVDPSEFSEPGAGGRLDVYQGVAAASGVMTGTGPGLSTGTAGDCTTASCPLWASESALEYYDTVFLACEGDPYAASKPPSAIQAMHDWLDEGGNLFAIHSQSIWFQRGPSDFQGVAAWKDFAPALGSGTYAINTAPIKEEALEQWLDGLGAATGSSIALSSVSDTVGASGVAATEWIADPAPADGGDADASTGDTKLLSFGTPIGGVDGGPGFGTGYCGKAVFSDIHAGSAPAGGLPDACQTGPLSAEEKALEFLLFDPRICVPQPIQPPPLGLPP
jgi:hypothetical protein